MEFKNPRTNKSGQKGVFFDKKAKTYYANIKCNKVRYNLGSFKSFEEAIDARIKGEEKYFGEFRRK